MICACQTSAMDMALMTMRQTIRATPMCDSRISLRKTRRIHSMVGVLLVPFLRVDGDSSLICILEAIAAPHTERLAMSVIVQKTSHLLANEKQLLFDKQKTAVQIYS